MVNAGVLRHPVTGDEVVGLVAAGGTRKVRNLRADPTGDDRRRAPDGSGRRSRAPSELVGPDDRRAGVDDEGLRVLLQDVFRAAGGTHDDWDEYDRAMAHERRAAVLIIPTRIYTNPG